jgi:hypothetical protein
MTNAPFTPEEAAQRAIDHDLRLDGEIADTPNLSDAVHWVSVYQELLAFKLELLERTGLIVDGMHEGAARLDAMTDVVLLRTQSERYRRRLREWTVRADELRRNR